jgi:pantoate--beta-alanine ligase
MAVCYLGLGSNLGDRKENIIRALQFLKADAAVQIKRLSGLYETDPQGCPSGTARFLNAAARIETTLPAIALLEKIKDIERRLGRVKSGRRFSSRPIDLDILLYDNKRINLPNLKIPHPRLKERVFVLKPLKEIAPEIIRSLARKVKVISGISRMRKFIAQIKTGRKTIGFVPTMGYLHEGHLSLIRQAKKDCDMCVVSIFVNPIQFGPREDYKKYPRDLNQDRILVDSAEGDCVFYPKDKEIYPKGYSTYVDVEKITEGLCAGSRPGHFRGVATVVAKLFNIIQPDIAYLGQKDYQQAMVVKKMVQDLDMPPKIKVMPIVRENDGLAMSSRNVYLDNQERQDAAILFQSLQKAKEMVSQGARNSRNIIREIKKMIMKKKTAKIDYVAVVDGRTLKPVSSIKKNTLIALAVWIGKTRLIDNLILR